LEFQPIVDLETNEVITVEALVRWQHGERGLLRPDEFVPDAEKYDLMATLTDEVARLATEQLGAWRNVDVDARIAMNVTSADVRDLGFVPRLAEHLERHALAAGCLEVELTEQTIMADVERCRQMIGELKQLGVGIGVDEFGTGYSSLPLLWELAPDRVKIDRTIIGGLAQHANRSIARAAVDLCRHLGISTVAVGVATPEELRIVAELGFGAAQGHMISPPRPADQLVGLLGGSRPAIADQVAPGTPTTGAGAEP
jgi:EAL domain-containing protein (putative c-di-GMP-specific phosphodiesterase class I)